MKSRKQNFILFFIEDQFYTAQHIPLVIYFFLSLINIKKHLFVNKIWWSISLKRN